MAVGVVWLLLGLVYWAAILSGGLLVFLSAPKGRRAVREAAYFAAVGLTVSSTALIPTLGIWVWVPVLFVAMLPLGALGELLS